MASTLIGRPPAEDVTKSIPKKKKKYNLKCSFLGCGSRQKFNPNLHFFRFPVKRPDIVEKWLINSGNEELTNLPNSALNCRKLCEKHFEKDCFRLNTIKKMLKFDAVPTLGPEEALDPPSLKQKIIAALNTPTNAQFKKYLNAKNRIQTQKQALTLVKRKLISKLKRLELKKCQAIRKHLASVNQTNYKCSYHGCGLQKKFNPNLRFFKFPVKRPAILEQWLINCGNETLINLPNSRLCSRQLCEKHFEVDCFRKTAKCTRLKMDAVPTVLLKQTHPQETADQVVPSSAVDQQPATTSDSTSNVPDTPNSTTDRQLTTDVKGKMIVSSRNILTPVVRTLLSKFKSSDIKKSKAISRHFAKREKLVLKNQKVQIPEGVIRKSRRRCCFLGCGTTPNKSPNLHFYRFPVHRPTVLEQWLVNCGDERLIDLTNKELRRRTVCEKHFEIHSFTPKKFLKKNAVPIVQLNDTSPEEILDQSDPSSTVDQVMATTCDISNDPAKPVSSPDRQPIPQKNVRTYKKRKQISQFKSSETKEIQITTSQIQPNNILSQPAVMASTIAFNNWLQPIAECANNSTLKKSRCKCCFRGCDLTPATSPNLRFYKFPVKRPTILEQWLINCGNERLIDLPIKTLRARKVCEKHFELNCFRNTPKKRLLKFDAVPTALAVDNTAPEKTPDQLASSSSTVDHLHSTSRNGTTNFPDTPNSSTDEQPIKANSSTDKQPIKANSSIDKRPIKANSSTDKQRIKEFIRKLIAEYAYDSIHRKSRSKCSFLGCGSTRKNSPNLRFYRFPISRPTILEQWIINCCNERLIDLPNKTLRARVVCEKHFELNCFRDPTISRRFLKIDAVPTLLGLNHTPEQTPDQAGPSPSRFDMLMTVREDISNSPDTPNIPIDKQSTEVRRKTNASLKTSQTSHYNKYKKVKNRTPMPQNNISSVKRKLTSKFKSSEVKKFQAIRHLSKRRIKITKSQIPLALKQYLPPMVFDFFSLQLSHFDSSNKHWNEEGRSLDLLMMSYASPR